MDQSMRIEKFDGSSTTLILRGLNRQTTREMLWSLLDETAPRAGMYDYIYVPWNTDGASNIGLAFANFVSAIACQEYLLALAKSENRGKMTTLHVRSIGPSRIQGRGSNLRIMLSKRGYEALYASDAPLVFHHGERTSLAVVMKREALGVSLAQLGDSGISGSSAQKQVPSGYSAWCLRELVQEEVDDVDGSTWMSENQACSPPWIRVAHLPGVSKITFDL
eukprot:symbB.v1.2.021823.t1/scaffold1881.1/size97231/1